MAVYSRAAAGIDSAALLIDHSSRGNLDQPRARMLRNTLCRPLHRGRNERFLHRILRGCEIVKTPDDRAEHLRR